MSFEINKDHNRIRLTPFGDNIIKLSYTTRDVFSDVSPIGIHLEEEGNLSVSEGKDHVEADAGRLSVRIDPTRMRMQWNSKGGKLFDVPAAKLADTPVIHYTTGGEEPVIRRVKTVDGERNFVENLRPVEDHTAYKCRLYFGWDEDEGIHGLGQGEEGIFNLRGHVQYLYQHNMRIPMPLFISDKGYGVLIDCGCLMTFNDDTDESYIFLKCVEQLDLYVIYGESFEEIVAGFRKLTGKASLLPKWAFGYVQSKEKYSSSKELVETAQRYRDLDIPIDCIVQDWKTWEGDSWGSKVLDQERYPDTYDIKGRLNALNVHSMISVWPNMNSGTPDYEEFMAAGKMLDDLATYDAFDEDARRMYWQQAKRGLYDKGFESWWCDSTEPFSGPDWGGEMMREPWERFELVGREHEKFLGQERANLYALCHARGMYENQRGDVEGRRMLNLTRSGYAGIQKYGTVLWSGDVSARWDVLKKQVAEALNVASSAFPYWTFDAGGFFVVNENWKARGCGCENDSSMKWFWHGDYENGLENKGYRELYVRWLQMAAFLPMMRSHGTDCPREIWNFGEEGTEFYDAIASAIRERYRLMPYIYSQAGRVWADDEMMIKPLYFGFSDDSRAKACDSEFMLGDSLLVCPVTAPMYYDRSGEPFRGEKKWDCYLPQGCSWTSFYDGHEYQGGQWVNADSPLSHIPVFVKAGSIIPMEEGLDYAAQRRDTPLEIRVYPGADAEYRFYEDAGEGYDYEKGIYNIITMKWDDVNKEFSMSEAPHSFAGGMTGRKCLVICNGTRQTFQYEGKDIRLKF